ncbi:unnamed protein product [Closterium sp. Yama58-4]|nr:unnamed protein product [Closterium sp. Yama58-4]
MDEDQGQLSVFLAFREKCDALEAAIQALSSRDSGSVAESAQSGINGGDASQQVGDAGSTQRFGLNADQEAVAALREVEELVAHFAPSVPRRDVEQMTSRVAALRANLESARSASKPKKRFAFSSRGQKKTLPENKDVPNSQKSLEQPKSLSSLQAVDGCQVEQEGDRRRTGMVPWSSVVEPTAASGGAAASAAAAAAAARGEAAPGTASSTAAWLGAAGESDASAGVPSAITPISSARPSLSISHRSHEHIQISPEQHRRGELTSQHLSHCHVSVRGVLSAVFLRHVRDCHVSLCPVSGACHVEDASGSTVAVASHQLRIHQTERADFYVRTRSRPLIEHSKGVRFAPYSREYDGLEADLKDADLAVDGGLWGHVDDFGWLRAVPSPNWSVIPEEERKSFTEA